MLTLKTVYTLLPFPAALLLAHGLYGIDSVSSTPEVMTPQTKPDSALPRLGDAIEWIGEIPEAPSVRSVEELPSARSGAAASTSGFTINRMNRNAVAAGYHEFFIPSEGYASRINWTGDASTCDAGTVSASFQEDVLRRINYYRAQVGLPADIALSATKNAKAQEAALMMAANNDLSHDPPNTWRCYTEGGYEAADNGNLSLGTFGPASIDRQIRDDGSNNTVVGHRRWLLYPRAQEMGSGSVPSNGTYRYTYPEHPSTSCVYVYGDFKGAQPAQGVAWPNEGYMPWSLAPNDGETSPRWSYSYAGADFSSATVTMTQGGVNIPVVLEPVADGYADNTLVWRPSGIPDSAPQSDTPYVVTISGVSGPITSVSYTVTLVDPYLVNDPPVISGSASPYSGVANTYNFTQTDQVDAYELTVFEDAPGTWAEGAEVSPAPQVIDGTTGYDLLSSFTKATGSRAFHLATPDWGEGDSFTVDRDVLPESGSTISFKYRRLFMHPDTKLRVELSTDGGASYTTINSIDGVNTGSETDWDSSFLTASVPVPAQFIDQLSRLRFRLEATGATFTKTEDTYGIYIDDISISNSREFLNPSTQSIAGSASSFDLTPASVGQSYQLTLRPQLGGHTFAYGPLLQVTSQALPAAPVITSVDEVWSAQGEVFSYTITATNAPTGYGATGLPTGASVNTETGIITGQIVVGDHSGINLSATNAGGTGTALLTIHVLSGYEQAINDLYPGLGLPGEDDDQDGTLNILEVAIDDRDPLAADSFSESNFSMDASGSDFVLSLKKSGVAGLDYVAKGSATLQGGSWTADGISVLTDTASDLEVSYPITSGEDYFIRVDISQNNETTSLPSP